MCLWLTLIGLNLPSMNRAAIKYLKLASTRYFRIRPGSISVGYNPETSQTCALPTHFSTKVTVCLNVLALTTTRCVVFTDTVCLLVSSLPPKTKQLECVHAILTMKPRQSIYSLLLFVQTIQFTILMAATAIKQANTLTGF